MTLTRTYRDELRERLGLIVPDECVKWDEEDAFGYQLTPDNPVTGWNRNVETFWRNQPEDSLEDLVKRTGLAR